MKFEEALKLLKEGKRLTRKEWSKIHLVIINNELMEYYGRGSMMGKSLELYSDDILAEDWEIIE